MFESAVQAAISAARGWTPDAPDPSGGRGCCPICLARLRCLVADGPLGDLPHGIAHPAAVAVDDLIAAKLDEAEDRYARDPLAVLLHDADREAEIGRRLDAARGALLMTALGELGAAAPTFTALRTRWVEPAIAAFLAAHATPEVPPTWV